VANHPAPRLLADAFGRWLVDASIEAAIVAYADKRAAQRLEPMAVRFAGWARRHGDDGWPRDARDVAWRRARELEDRVCAAADCRPEDVERLAWTARALHVAAEARVAGAAGLAP
jgi:hypothetical protein